MEAQYRVATSHAEPETVARSKSKQTSPPADALGLRGPAVRPKERLPLDSLDLGVRPAERKTKQARPWWDTFSDGPARRTAARTKPGVRPKVRKKYRGRELDPGPKRLQAQIDGLHRDVPDYGPARLLVAAAGGGEVAVGGWITPARIVHATRAGNVIVGDHCTLRQTEHHHFDRVSVTTKGVFDQKRVRRALADLVAHPRSARRDVAFRRALAKTLRTHEAAEPTDLPLAARHTDVITRSGVVQVGAHSELATETPVYVRETLLPLAELLVGSRQLRRAFVEALRDPSATGSPTRTFLAQMLKQARCTDHLQLLSHAAESGVYDASVFGLFGFTKVSNAGAVLAGAGNTLIRGIEVDVRQFADDDIATILRDMRAEFAPSPEPIAPEERVGVRAEPALRTVTKPGKGGTSVPSPVDPGVFAQPPEQGPPPGRGPQNDDADPRPPRRRPRPPAFRAGPDR